MTGLKLSDVLNPLAEAIGAVANKLKPLVDNYQQTITEVGIKVAAVRERPSHEMRADPDFAEVLRKIDELDKQFTRILLEMKSVRKARSRYDVCAILIVIYSSESRREAKAFAEQVRNEHLGIIKVLGECYQKHNSLKAEANQFTYANKHVETAC